MTRAFRLTPPELGELDIHEACAKALDAVLLAPAEFACYPAGHVQLTPAQTARLVRVGLKRGMPDLLIFYQTCWGIELKRHSRRLSKSRIVRTRRGALRHLVGQEEMFERLVRSGAFGGIAVVETVDEMLAQLDRWQIPLRARVSL